MYYSILIHVHIVNIDTYTHINLKHTSQASFDSIAHSPQHSCITLLSLSLGLCLCEILLIHTFLAALGLLKCIFFLLSSSLQSSFAQMQE